MGRFITHNFKLVLLKMFVKLLLFAIAVRVGAAVGENAPAEYKLKRIQDLKDLLTLSVENTISLNSVVTAHTQQNGEQTQQISELMIAMSSNKIQMDALNVKYSDALDKIAQLEAKDQQLEAKDQQFEAKTQQLEAKDHELEAKDHELEAKNHELEAKDHELEAKDQELETKDQQLEAKDQELKVLTDELRADLELVENPVTILNGEEANGNPKCAKVCSGTTGRSTTPWNSGVSVNVDITSCGFINNTITTSIEGSSDGLYSVTGTSAVYRATTTRFEMFLGGNDRKATVRTYATSSKWNVEWIAVGFSC